MIPLISRIFLAIAISPAYVSNSFHFASWPRQIAAGNRRMHSSKVSAMPGELTVNLEKPLGITLEEIEVGAAKGVYVASVKEEGSAFSSDVKDLMIGMALKSVMGTRVRDLMFDDVMAAILGAPSLVTLELEPMTNYHSSNTFPLGTVVNVTVLEGDKETVVEMKVGDNLRLCLLAGGFEVYRGFKSKIGNCGGGGQCAFCAVDFLSNEGWGERSEYEDSKLKKSPEARLSCLNNIQGPAVIRLV